jgi:hypothetical protein
MGFSDGSVLGQICYCQGAHRASERIVDLNAPIRLDTWNPEKRLEFLAHGTPAAINRVEFPKADVRIYISIGDAFNRIPYLFPVLQQASLRFGFLDPNHPASPMV